MNQIPQQPKDINKAIKWFSDLSKARLNEELWEYYQRAEGIAIKYFGNQWHQNKAFNKSSRSQDFHRQHYAARYVSPKPEFIFEDCDSVEELMVLFEGWDDKETLRYTKLSIKVPLAIFFNSKSLNNWLQMWEERFSQAKKSLEETEAKEREVQEKQKAKKERSNKAFEIEIYERVKAQKIANGEKL